MAVPTLAQQRQADLSLLYDKDLPWVVEAILSGASDPVLMRIHHPDPDVEGEDIQRDIVHVRVQKADWSAPAYRDAVTISGQSWRVAQVTLVSDFEWRLVLEKNVRVGFSR